MAPARDAGHIVLTGASSGIGAAAAIELTRRGRQVLAMGRSPAKLDRVHREMAAVAPAGVDVPAPIAADFSALQEVRRSAAQILERCDRIGVLINNAGVQPVRRQVSADGFELGLAVNHLAPFLLTNLLQARLLSSGGRVVVTASSNHADGSIDFSDLQMERRWSSRASYDRSKLANVLFAGELRRRTQVPVSALHPGSISTDLNRDSRWYRLVKPFERIVYATPAKGADTIVWLATSEEGAAPRALYYAAREPAEASDQARDRDLAARLWRESARLTGLHVAEHVQAVDGSGV